MSKEEKKNAVLIFEKPISEANRKRLESAGYMVVCTDVPYKVLGSGNIQGITRAAFEFLAGLAPGSMAKRDFGEDLINMLLKELRGCDGR